MGIIGKLLGDLQYHAYILNEQRALSRIVHGNETIDFNRRLDEEFVRIFTEADKIGERVIVKEIRMELKHKEVRVDYQTGQIYVRGTPLKMELPEGFDYNYRHMARLNFVRRKKLLSSDGKEKSDSIKCYGLGWEAHFKDKVIRRVVLLFPETLESMNEFTEAKL